MTHIKYLGTSVCNLIFPPSEDNVLLQKLSAEDIFNKWGKTKEIQKDVWSIFSYREKVIKEMISQLKFVGNRRCARICGQIISTEISKRISTKNYLLIPIPIHKKRRKERGYNQCEWICVEIMRHVHNIEYKNDLLIRTKYNVKQSWSNRKERLENISGHFRAKEVRGARIILIDDVLTTGATIEEARRVLLDSGALQVLVFTIAH